MNRLLTGAIILAVNIQGQDYNLGLPTPATDNGSALQTILSLVIGIVAAISVLFVVIGGLRYVFSDGDPQDASRAKSTIIYALIGLIVAVLAEAIVAFVLSNKTLVNI